MPNMKVSISYGSKVIAKVKVDNRQTNKQTDKDRTKTICPRSFDPGGIKISDSPVKLRKIMLNYVVKY